MTHIQQLSFAGTVRLALRLSTCIVLVLLSTSCDLFDGPVDKVIAAMRDTMSTLNSNSQQWQSLLTKLEKALADDGSDIAKEALAKVNDIQREAIANIGEQARCSEDVMAKSVRYEILKLTNSYLTTKKNAAAIVEAAPTPIVCTYSPNSIDLATTDHVIQVSGANFLDAPKPRVRVVGKDILNDLADPESVTIQTNWHMTILLDDLLKRQVLGPNARKLTIDWNLAKPPAPAEPASSASRSAGLISELPQPELAVIQPPSCTDGLKNAKETDVDCGGSACGACKVGKMCNGVDANCESNACVAGVCGIHKWSSTVSGWIDFGGNTLAGHTEQTTQCPADSVAVGFQVRAGADIDKIGLFCSRVNSDGTTGPGAAPTEMIGGPENPTLYQAPCPSGVLVGLIGRADVFPGRLTGQCNLLPDIAHQTAQSPTPLKHIDGPTVHGSRDAGPDVMPYCPPGSAISGIRVAHGAWIDHLWFQCRAISREVAPAVARK